MLRTCFDTRLSPRAATSLSVHIPLDLGPHQLSDFVRVHAAPHGPNLTNLSLELRRDRSAPGRTLFPVGRIETGMASAVRAALQTAIENANRVRSMQRAVDDTLAQKLLGAAGRCA